MNKLQTGLKNKECKESNRQWNTGNDTNMKIICRHADNDFVALLVAQGMENASASIISIAHNGMHHPYGAMIPRSKFVVFARVESQAIALVDDAIKKEMERCNIIKSE